jgi:hypothetical protein
MIFAHRTAAASSPSAALPTSPVCDAAMTLVSRSSRLRSDLVRDHEAVLAAV